MQKNVNYGENIIYSLKLLKNNINLFLPDLLFYIYSTILGYILLYLNGISISKFLLLPQDITTSIQTMVSSTPLIMLKLLISIVVFVVLTAIFGIGTASLKYTLIKNKLRGKRKFLDSYKESKKFWIRLFCIKFIIMFVYMIIFLVLFLGLTSLTGIGAIADAEVWESILLGIILLASLLVTYILVKLPTYFVYPTLYFNNHGVFKTLKESFKYFKNNFKHLLITLLTIVAITLVMSLTVLLVFSSTTSYLKLILDGKLLFIIIFLIGIIKKIVEIGYELWTEIIIFKNY